MPVMTTITTIMAMITRRTLPRRTSTTMATAIRMATVTVITITTAAAMKRGSP